MPEDSSVHTSACYAGGRRRNHRAAADALSGLHAWRAGSLTRLRVPGTLSSRCLSASPCFQPLMLKLKLDLNWPARSRLETSCWPSPTWCLPSSSASRWGQSCSLTAVPAGRGEQTLRVGLQAQQDLLAVQWSREELALPGCQVQVTDGRLLWNGPKVRSCLALQTTGCNSLR